MYPEHRRELLLDFLDRFVIAYRRGPTLAELSVELRVSEMAIRRDLLVLREQGSVTWLSHKPYTLRVTRHLSEVHQTE